MADLLIYCIQVNILLTIVYLGYYFLLKGLTFYKLNRVYMIVGAIYSFAYPLLDVKSWFLAKGLSVELPEAFPVAWLGPLTTSPQAFWSGDRLVVMAVALGAVFLLAKFVLQLCSLWRIRRRSVPAIWQSYWYRYVLFPIVPFSFFNTIYLHKEQHREVELKDIFEHEIVHVRGMHTLDILLFEMLVVVCWFNPLVWLMRRAVRQNLEFLTDQQVLNRGGDRQAYQYSLLHVTRDGVHVGVSSHFNFKTLKKRIMMMNKKRSSKMELSKYAFMLPVMILAGASFTVTSAEEKVSKMVEQVKEVQVQRLLNEFDKPLVPELRGSLQDTLPVSDTTKTIVVGRALKLKGTPLFVVDGVPTTDSTILEKLDANKISSMDVLRGDKVTAVYGSKGKNGVVLITTKKEKNLKSSGGVVADSSRIKEVVVMGYGTKKNNDNQPIFLVDGEQMESVEKLNPNSIESMHVLRGDTATAVYGSKGKNGVVIITKKKGEAGADSVSNGRLVVKGFRAKSDKEPVVIFKGHKNLDGKQPLYVIDGEVKDDSFDMESLDPSQIEEISVLKGESAVALYGEAGKDGAILITTKKFRPEK